ncbi:hypothetical protein BK666_01145 [Pseudomonas frederiksbergensis]|uniref:Uncharacterized protein n=1 Tax=Pseudomonas frederiksbergensis TaxID=104087 RepID=A0A423KJJ4_9PSED|nr:hypothetical protein [Pseudomonas frederiksbergensis]RON53396.1 hypothetical protein BK666_01145 [Pseudomonas frederiksbergensis]
MIKKILALGFLLNIGFFQGTAFAGTETVTTKIETSIKESKTLGHMAIGTPQGPSAPWTKKY